MIKYIPRFKDHLWYPILVPMGGGHRIVEMLGKEANSYNDRLERWKPIANTM